MTHSWQQAQVLEYVQKFAIRARPVPAPGSREGLTEVVACPPSSVPIRVFWSFRSQCLKASTLATAVAVRGGFRSRFRKPLVTPPRHVKCLPVVQGTREGDLENTDRGSQLEAQGKGATRCNRRSTTSSL